MQALPIDIRNLPKYSVPKQLFICTGILLVFFLILGLVLFIVWMKRSRDQIHNYQYIVDHNIRREFQHAKKTFKSTIKNSGQQQNQVIQSADSNSSYYKPEKQQDQMIYHRQQARILQFVCLSVIVAININAYVCNIMEIISYFIAVALYLLFNIIKVVDNSKLRLLFFIPLIVCYIPFLAFKKQINQL